MQQTASIEALDNGIEIVPTIGMIAIIGDDPPLF